MLKQLHVGQRVPWKLVERTRTDAWGNFALAAPRQPTGNLEVIAIGSSGASTYNFPASHRVTDMHLGRASRGPSLADSHALSSLSCNTVEEKN